VYLVQYYYRVVYILLPVGCQLIKVSDYEANNCQVRRWATMRRVFWETSALMIMPCAGMDDASAAMVSASTSPGPLPHAV